jgi:hypothetical protein
MPLLSAAISPDASRWFFYVIVKLAFKDFTTDNFLSGKVSELKLHHFSQKTFALKTIQHY